MTGVSPSCPSCGVAVVPGYVKCPKCHAALPYGSGRRSRLTADPGGTALEERGVPWLPVLGALGVAAAIVIVFVVLGRSGDEPAATTPATPAQPLTTPTTAVAPTASPTPSAPTATAPASRNPTAAAAELDRALRRQKLWSTVEVTGPRIDVRSAACGDAAMTPVIDSAVPALREAGLTRLRCLAQSGAVVLERDL
ncbi:MAG TPA: hypothetical protein VFQ53_03285 [Kofleriaceae bacterium]|nr:hypothetical protein [Kofleriaceae bacterium]